MSLQSDRIFLSLGATRHKSLMHSSEQLIAQSSSRGRSGYTQAHIWACVSADRYALASSNSLAAWDTCAETVNMQSDDVRVSFIPRLSCCCVISACLKQEKAFSCLLQVLFVSRQSNPPSHTAHPPHDSLHLTLAPGHAGAQNIMNIVRICNSTR